MSICVVVDQSGAIISQANTPMESCSGFLLLTKSEYAVTAIAGEVFRVPQSDELSAAFGWGFITPMTIGLIAWSVALIVNFFKEKSS